MNKRNFFSFGIIVAILLSVSACQDQPAPTVPSVVTFPVSDIEQQSATGGGSVTTDATAIKVCGLCWSTKSNPTLTDNFSSDGVQPGSFVGYMTNLKPDSTYYVRAYATNDVGTAYGSTMKFTTKHAVISVITLPITEIKFNAATGGAVIIPDNGVTVAERGLCWSLTAMPTIADKKVVVGSGAGSFAAVMDSLAPNSTYYVRAYAMDAGGGVIYGSMIVFNTRQIALDVTTLTVSDVNQNSATCGGIVSSDLPASVTARGVCWSSTSTNPTVDEFKTLDNVGTGSYTSMITGLSNNTTYYVRAYATNMEGTVYGSTMSFKTAPGLVTLSTISVYNIDPTSAKCDVKVLNNGGSDVISVGVCWAAFTNPTTNNTNTYTTTLADNMTFNITGLLEYTTYYVRSFATNQYGTSYGNNIKFVTTGITANNGIIFNQALTYGTVSDVQGNVYKTVTIGTQTWMAENLRTTQFRNGDSIPTTPLFQSITDTEPVYQWEYLNPAVYGRLYTWYAATDSRNICPEGYHLATDAEWLTLVNYLGGTSVAGAKIKETGTSHWNSNSSATNISGMTALPAGYIQINQTIFAGGAGSWWSSGTNNSDTGVSIYIIGQNSAVQFQNINKSYGQSIRCIKD